MFCVYHSNTFFSQGKCGRAVGGGLGHRPRKIEMFLEQKLECSDKQKHNKEINYGNYIIKQLLDCNGY